MTWDSWNAAAPGVQAIANVIQAIFAVAAAGGVWLVWFQIREAKKDRRQKFFQVLLNGIFSHNWRFLEHWDNAGVRPGLVQTKTVEQNEEHFGKRVVVLDHVNILWQIFLHREDLHATDIDGFRSWARDWFASSEAQLKEIFDQGDIYPLDFVSWLKDEVFLAENFSRIVGRGLQERLTTYEARRKKTA